MQLDLLVWNQVNCRNQQTSNLSSLTSRQEITFISALEAHLNAYRRKNTPCANFSCSINNQSHTL